MSDEKPTRSALELFLRFFDRLLGRWFVGVVLVLMALAWLFDVTPADLKSFLADIPAILGAVIK